MLGCLKGGGFIGYGELQSKDFDPYRCLKWLTNDVFDIICEREDWLRRRRSTAKYKLCKEMQIKVKIVKVVFHPSFSSRKRVINNVGKGFESTKDEIFVKKISKSCRNCLRFDGRGSEDWLARCRCTKRSQR